MFEELNEMKGGGCKKSGRHGKEVVGEVIRGLVSLVWTLGII